MATQNIAKSGKQAISQEEYAQRVAAAGEQAAAQFDADMQQQAERMQQESIARWLSVEQNTITDVDGKRHIKEITNTDVRGNTEIGYKKAEIPSSKKKAVAGIDNAAKYLGKTIVWYEGALQVNGQYRLANGFRAPDGTIYLNINAEDPLMVAFGHEMFHDLVAHNEYASMIKTLTEDPTYDANLSALGILSSMSPRWPQTVDIGVDILDSINDVGLRPVRQWLLSACVSRPCVVGHTVSVIAVSSVVAHDGVAATCIFCAILHRIVIDSGIRLWYHASRKAVAPHFRGSNRFGRAEGLRPLGDNSFFSCVVNQIQRIVKTIRIAICSFYIGNKIIPFSIELNRFYIVIKVIRIFMVLRVPATAVVFCILQQVKYIAIGQRVAQRFCAIGR